MTNEFGSGFCDRQRGGFCRTGTSAPAGRPPSEDAARIGLGARGVWNSATCAASGMRFPSPFEEAEHEPDRQARSEMPVTCLPASLRALAVSSSARVHRSLVHRWFQGWGLGQIVAMRQASLRATAPMMTILLHPPGSEGGRPIKWTVRRPAGKPGSPPHATADQRDEVHVLLPDLIDDLGQASGQGHAGDLHALALLHGPEPGA